MGSPLRLGEPGGSRHGYCGLPDSLREKRVGMEPTMFWYYPAWFNFPILT